MAGEVSLQARMARNKLRTNLSLLSNASTRKAEKLREYEHVAQVRESKTVWVTSYVLVFSVILVLLGNFFYLSK